MTPEVQTSTSFRLLIARDSSSSAASTTTTGPVSSPCPTGSNRKVTQPKRSHGFEYSFKYVFLAVELGSGSFQAVWILMFLLRCWCILFLAWSARLYWFVAHPYMEYYASLLGPSAVTNFQPMGVCFGALAVLHVFQLLTMVYASFVYSTLAMGPPPTSLGPDGGSTCYRGWFRSPRGFVEALHRDMKRVFFDRHGPFGVESRYFFLRMLGNEVIEIASQTTQVRKASVLVSKVWMNNLYVIMTVFNAWSTPLVRCCFPRRGSGPPTAASAAIERLVCLAVDFCLDAATGMAIPMLTFLPYYLTFDFDLFNFEIAYLYDDIWFANMVMENQQIFALTQWDFVNKMIPHLSIYLSLNSIRALVRHPRTNAARVYCADATSSSRSDSETDKLPGNNKPQEKRMHKSGSVAAIPEEAPAQLPYPSEKEGFVNGLKIEALVRPDSLLYRRVQHLLGIVLFLSGLAVLVLHLLASWTALNTKMISCATMSRPWFATKVSCNVVRFNCHMNNVTTVSDADLEMINPSSVSALVFSHCPQLRIPPHIRDFHNLLGIDMYNCTLVEWSVNAAVTPDAHPKITYIIFVRTNMTRLPETMIDFEIAVSNITELPADLHERWHSMALFYVEHAQLTEFPPTLQYLSISEVSLLGNKITALPEFDPTVTQFYSLTLAHNPLARLPTSIGDTANLGFLSFGHTELSEFPPWMDTVATTASRIYIHNTPFCAVRTQADLETRYGRDAVMTCDMASDVRRDGLYPLVIMAPRRLFDENTPPPPAVDVHSSGD